MSKYIVYNDHKFVGRDLTRDEAHNLCNQIRRTGGSPRIEEDITEPMSKKAQIILDTADFSEPNFQEFLKDWDIEAFNLRISPNGDPQYLYRGYKEVLLGMMWLFWKDDLSASLTE